MSENELAGVLLFCGLQICECLWWWRRAKQAKRKLQAWQYEVQRAETMLQEVLRARH